MLVHSSTNPVLRVRDIDRRITQLCDDEYRKAPELYPGTERRVDGLLDERLRLIAPDPALTAYLDARWADRYRHRPAR
jgi:hypothetical protein